MARIIIIETASLGDRSYLAHDGEFALVVDPQRDIDRVLAVADEEGVRITHVFETHIHNDYVTGGLALAEATRATYVVSANDEVAFDRSSAHDGSQFDVGQLTVTALATPGHTQNHLSYALAETGGEPIAVFTGGSMLFGAVGRTDLVAPERTDALTRHQYQSVRRLARELPAAAQVHPTHGFGSFCSATATSGTESTIGEQRVANIALRIGDEDEFVRQLVAGLGAYPRYYAHMGPLNAGGPPAPELSAVMQVDAAELRRRIDVGEWVVDLRQRRAFARHHVTGTISIELGDSFTTFLGWTMPWGTPLTLIGDTTEVVAKAQRELVRIGIDHLAGAATGTVDSLSEGRTSRYEVSDFAGLAAAGDRDGLVVLDVRRPDEWDKGHLAAAFHIPFWELENRIAEVPEREVWVHCASGFRASIAASLLDRAGKRVVLIDDDWSNAAHTGLAMAE